MHTQSMPLRFVDSKTASGEFEAAYEAWTQASARARQAEDLVQLKQIRQGQGAGTGPTAQDLAAASQLRDVARVRLQYALGLLGARPL